MKHITRRRFLETGAAALGAQCLAPEARAMQYAIPAAEKPFKGPNVIIIRFGGGVRRRETIDPQHTHSPWFLHELRPRGTLFTHMEIAQLEGVETSHGQGTLYILTGKYERYKDVGGKFLGQRFEAPVPTLFEYLRKAYGVPEHETLIINGEDRTDEEFYSFSNHHLFGAEYRSNVLSLYRFKTFLLRWKIEEFAGPDAERETMEAELAKLEALDYRMELNRPPDPKITAFWKSWRNFYGDSGLVNPRGDRLLTELALRAMRELRPKLMMVNYNDPDYVHWGNPAFYTRGVSIIDQGMRQLVEAAEADEHYRDNTCFVIVPDCGRDNNRMMAVPFQHHFNSRSAHEIFALVMGPGVTRGAVADRPVGQADIAPTVGALMGFPTEFAEGSVLEEAIA